MATLLIKTNNDRHCKTISQIQCRFTFESCKLGKEVAVGLEDEHNSNKCCEFPVNRKTFVCRTGTMFNFSVASLKTTSWCWGYVYLPLSTSFGILNLQDEPQR